MTDRVLTFQDGTSDPFAPHPSPVVHRLRTWPPYFEEVLLGRKTFEVRLNDRDYRRGDVLELVEWAPDAGEETGRVYRRRVTYATTWGQPGNQVVLALGPEDPTETVEVDRLELEAAQDRLEALETFAGDVARYLASPGAEEDVARWTLEADDLEAALEELFGHLREVTPAPTGVAVVTSEREAHRDGYAAGMDHDRDEPWDEGELAAWEERQAPTGGLAVGEDPQDPFAAPVLFRVGPDEDPGPDGWLSKWVRETGESPNATGPFDAAAFEALLPKLPTAYPAGRLPGPVSRFEGREVTSSVPAFMGIPLVVDETLPPSVIRFAHPDGRSDYFHVGSSLRGPLAPEELALLKLGHDLPKLSAPITDEALEVWRPAGRYRAPDEVEGRLSAFDRLARRWSFLPDGERPPAIIGAGFRNPYRYLGRDEVEGYVRLDEGGNGGD